MRDEYLDWEIYHLLVERKARTTGDLEAAGYDPSRVEASLSRLEMSYLIERRGDMVRPLSPHEAILLCRLKNDTEFPLFCEDGVIRLRPEKDGKV